LVEFANGATNTTWGAKRAAMGHPQPFKMKLLGVGNEQWGQQYIDRYTLFAKALKEKYPNLELVSAAGPSPDDDRFKFAWPKLRELHADLIDEHCYANPNWFFANTHRYDHYDRNGPKVFMGEYAAQSKYTVSPKNQNNLGCALSEAAYMTGLERNGDVVRMASYAPLFANTEAWQWTPDMIWVNSLQLYKTPNYYVQQLFCRNRGDVILPVQLDGIETSTNGVQSLYASATRDEQTGEVILKVVNPKADAGIADIKLAGVSQIESEGKSVTLTGDDFNEVNSMEAPEKISPVESKFETGATNFSYTFPPRSLTVLRITPR
jgi:alpha-N-arabinofuranosidase